LVQWLARRTFFAFENCTLQRRVIEEDLTGRSLLTQQGAAIIAKLFQIGRRPGFNVTANERLCAARAKGHPFPTGENEFKTVSRDEFVHRQIPHAPKAAREFLQKRLFFFRRN
jgi:hypothetical protein